MQKYFKKKPNKAALSNALALFCSKNEHFEKLIKTFDLVETPTESIIQVNKQTIKKQEIMKVTKPIAKPIAETTTKTASKPVKKEETKTAIFADGVLAFKPSDKAPEGIIADVIISIDRFEQFINESAHLLHSHEKYGSQLKMTLKRNEANQYYFTINTYGLDV
jgi:hypothetical protein